MNSQSVEDNPEYPSFYLTSLQSLQPGHLDKVPPWFLVESRAWNQWTAVSLHRLFASSVTETVLIFSSFWKPLAFLGLFYGVHVRNLFLIPTPWGSQNHRILELCCPDPSQSSRPATVAMTWPPGLLTPVWTWLCDVSQGICRHNAEAGTSHLSRGRWTPCSHRCTTGKLQTKWTSAMSTHRWSTGPSPSHHSRDFAFQI